MRILYQHRTLGDGAEGVHISEMISAFREIGHDIEVVCPNSAAAGREETGVASNDSWVARVKRMTPRIVYRAAELAYNAKSYWATRRALRRFRPEFMYERYACFNFGGVLAAQQAKVPVILEVNTPYSFAWKRYDRLYFPRTASRIEQWMFRRADRIVTVSSALKDFLVEEGVPAEKVFVTPNAINPSRVTFDEPAAEDSVPFPASAPVIGFVGSLRVWHGIPLLMEAIPGILKSCPGCHFLIVGDGDLRGELEVFIRERGLEDTVTLTGNVSHDDVFKHLKSINIAVLPDANFYMSPLKVFEYMAMGKAIVAPRLGPLEEVITPDVHGKLFPPLDTDAFCKAVAELAGDVSLRQRLGRAAREHVLTNHTWSHNARAIVSSYEELVADQSVARRSLSVATS